jgi:hypothetical protein
LIREIEKENVRKRESKRRNKGNVRKNREKGNVRKKREKEKGKVRKRREIEKKEKLNIGNSEQ